MFTIEYIRQFRVLGYAIFDLAASLLGVYLLAPLSSKLFLKINIVIPRKSWMFLTFPLGIAVHLLSGQLTPMTVQFLDPSSHYILKVFIILMLLFGFKEIKFIKKK